MNEILGEQIELNKYDAMESARMSVSGKVIKHFINLNGSGGFYLLRLDKPFAHRNIEQNHVLFWSPLIQRKNNIEEQFDAFVLLIPNMTLLNVDAIDEKRLIPFEWVTASRKTFSKNVFPNIASVINMVRHKAIQVSIAY